MSRTVAITGASGYLGGLLEKKFAEEGWDTVALVRSPRRPTDRSFVLGRDVPDWALAGVDVLIHTAYDMKVTAEDEIWRINVEGTKLLLKAATAAGVGRIIVLSSMSAYPGTRQLYGRAKLDIESAAADHGAIVIRPGLVIGPGAGGMAGALAKLVALPITPTVRGAGHQFPISAQDFVRTVYRLATCAQEPTEPIGLASPNPIAFDAVLRSIAADSDRKPPRLLPVPWQMIHAVLRAGERAGLNLPFRADSLLGLVHPASSVPGRDALSALGFHLEDSQQ